MRPRTIALLGLMLPATVSAQELRSPPGVPVGGPVDTNTVRPAGNGSSVPLFSLLTGLGRAEAPPQGGFWTNRAGDPGTVAWRFTDRVFVGNAAKMTTDRAATNATWLPDIATGANWGPRDSQFVVMHTRGGQAVMGASRASDGDAVNGIAPIGVGGFVINDTSVDARAAWALYADVQHQPVTTNAASYGVEIAAKNKGANISGDPYGVSYGVHGIWMQGGGDNSYGGNPTAPNNSAITVVKGSSTWNTGITFASDSLTGTDGVTGTASAIKMAKGHTVQWFSNAGGVGARIRSDVTISNRSSGLIFDNFSVYFQTATGNPSFRFNDANSGGLSVTANYPQFTTAAAGAAPVLNVAGSDANIALAITGKGSSGLLGGVFTRSADPTTSDIPSGQCADWNNTTALTYKRVCNFGGSIKSITYN